MEQSDAKVLADLSDHEVLRALSALTAEAMKRFPEFAAVHEEVAKLPATKIAQEIMDKVLAADSADCPPGPFEGPHGRYQP